METIWLPISLTFIIISLSFYTTSLWRNLKKTGGRDVLPPGRKGLPFIGETLAFVRYNWTDTPQKFITDRMREFSPKIFKTSLIGEKNVAVFCGASGNKFLFTGVNEHVTMGIPNTLTKIMFSSDIDTSKFAKEGRKLSTEFLKPEFLQQIAVGVMDQLSKQHFKKHWVTREKVLVSELAKKYTFDLACFLFLSIDDIETVEKLKDLFKNIISGILAIPINFPGTSFHLAIKSSHLIRKEILLIIKQRKLDVVKEKYADVKSLKDMLSRILLSTFGEDGEFPNEMIIVDMIFGLLFASNDPTSSTITCMVKYLTELPRVYAQVLEEQITIANNKPANELLNWEDIKKMKYTWNVACETMRLAPPSPGSFREVVTEFTYAGFTIPKGWKAYWSVHSTHRDSEYFKNPEEFDPTRFQDNGPPPFTFVPFGGGSHLCSGREYARIEILVFIHNLVTQFHFEKILQNEKIVFPSGATPANGLPIRLHPRNMSTK